IGSGFADDVDDNRASMRPRSVLPEIDALPGSKAQTSVINGHAQVYRGHGGANVRWHVIVALDRVNEEGIAIWNEPREETLEVPAHVRVGVLLDDKRGGRVLQVKRAEAGADAGGPHAAGHFARDVVEPAPIGFDGEPIEQLLQRQRPFARRRSYR